MPVALPRYLYLDVTKTRVLEEGDPLARYALGGPGSLINDDLAEACGLVEYLNPPPKSEPPPVNKARPPVANKKR